MTIKHAETPHAHRIAFGDPSTEDHFRVGGTYLTKDKRKAVLLGWFDDEGGRPLLALIEDGRGYSYPRKYQAPSEVGRILFASQKLERVHDNMTPASKDDLFLPPAVKSSEWINIFRGGPGNRWASRDEAISITAGCDELLHRVNIIIYEDGSVRYSVHDVAADHQVIFSTPKHD